MLFLALTGGFILFILILKHLFKNHLTPDSFVLINAANTNSIEHTVRKTVCSHPKSDIYIINRTNNPEMHKILKLLKADYPALYIIDIM